jgi:hypothetical protein
MAKGKWQRTNGKWFFAPFEMCHLPFEIPFELGH